MVKVFLTVDTEVWPRFPDWRATGLCQDLDRDIYGRTAAGEFGLHYQIDRLNHYGLKAVFFVEALFACVVGLQPLRKIVQTIQENGQEVQLHLHSEWLEWMAPSILPGRKGQNLKDFTLEEQVLLLRQGLQHLRDCGAKQVCAFRAGNYGANFDTLRALSRIGLAFDTSHNTCYLRAECGLRTPNLLFQPREICGVLEFPVSFFADWPGHYRHAQLCACSSRELKQALLGAWKANWHSFVIVSHSFELIKDRKGFAKTGIPDRLVIRRFDKLCRFLASNKDKFQTTGFSEIDPKAVPTVPQCPPIRSSVHRTAGRLVEQLVRRVF